MKRLSPTAAMSGLMAADAIAGPREEKNVTRLKLVTSLDTQPDEPKRQRCELVVAATEMALGAIPGLLTVASVGERGPVAPSFPPAAITSMPVEVAVSTAWDRRSQGTPGATPQTSPESSGPAKA